MTEQSKNSSPIIPSHVTLPEITLRVIVLGTILTIVLAAANAYLGLKLGATVSASIPAAVISMGILRFFRHSNILENTMVQTMASVGESLTAGIAFILPALIIMGAWDGFSYWQTVLVGLLGGGLGVLFTIPLRRALLQDKALRYPEGMAIGNVLKASAAREEGDLRSLAMGGLVGAGIELCQTGLRLLTDSFSFWFKTSTTVFGFGLGLSPALIAAGYIVGINVALSLLVGVIIGWLAGVPVLTWFYGMPDGVSAAGIANQIWSSHIRYMGVGAMLVGGMWTLLSLIKPIIDSVMMSLASLRKVNMGAAGEVPRTERDISMHYVFIGVAAIMLPIFLMIAYVVIPIDGSFSNGLRFSVSFVSMLYVLIGGFVFCSIMAYFAGLIGSSNSPVSGLLVSALLILSLLLLGLFGTYSDFISKLGPVIAIGSSVIIGAALAISNDTMQDLKVGDIVGATPWKQQVMLILGVIISAFVVPPILQLLFNAYGIGGVFPRPGMNPAQMLAAPQAGLMATVAKGAFSHQLEWLMIGVGAVVAIVCIFIDEILKRQYATRLPVLAVGLGIYLPLFASIPCVIGGVLSYVVQNRLGKIYKHRGVKETEEKMNAHRHRGLLLSCGIVAGASIMGVVLAIPFAIKESTDALSIVPDSYLPYAGLFSIIATFILCTWIYRSVISRF